MLLVPDTVEKIYNELKLDSAPKDVYVTLGDYVSDDGRFSETGHNKQRDVIESVIMLGTVFINTDSVNQEYKRQGRGLKKDKFLEIYSGVVSTATAHELFHARHHAMLPDYLPKSIKDKYESEAMTYSDKYDVSQRQKKIGPLFIAIEYQNVRASSLD